MWIQRARRTVAASLAQAAFGRTTAEAYDTEESCLDCTAPDCAYRVNSVSNGVLACSIAESSTPIGCLPQIVLPARDSRAQHGTKHDWRIHRQARSGAPVFAMYSVKAAASCSAMQYMPCLSSASIELEIGPADLS